MANLTKKQQIFRDQFAKETGLDRRFVGAWMLAEQSAGAARNYDRRNYNNWLNIGNTDALVASGGSFKSSVWSDPRRAAKASADWMRGKGPVAKSYGRPAAGITRILDTAGKGAEAQIRALSSSGWASSGYNGGQVLRQLMRLPQGGGRSTAVDDAGSSSGSSSKRGSGAARSRTASETSTTTDFDSEGYESALRRARAGSVLKQLGGGKRWRMLSSLLPDESSVVPEQFVRSTTTTTETPLDGAEPAAGRASAKKKSGSKGSGRGIPGLKGLGSGVYELFHDPVGGYKHGQSIGPIGGHGGHAHVAAGPKTVKGYARLAQQMGLRVGEHPDFGGVAPVHTAGSYHDRPGGQAIDVTGDPEKLKRFTRRIMEINGFR